MKEIKLELKHLAPYLPYKLRVKYWDRNVVMNAGTGSSTNWIGITALIQRQNNIECLPILRPLSDITKEIEVNEKTKILIDNLQELYPTYYFAYNATDDLLIKRNNEQYSWHSDILGIQEFLLKNHIDIFGLISKGLAIDINTL